MIGACSRSNKACPLGRDAVNDRQVKLLSGLVKQLGSSLLAIPGVGALGAAMILGETAGASRFKSKHAFARFNGTAPVPVWSGNKVRVRLNGQPATVTMIRRPSEALAVAA